MKPISPTAYRRRARRALGTILALRRDAPVLRDAPAARSRHAFAYQVHQQFHQLLAKFRLVQMVVDARLL